MRQEIPSCGLPACTKVQDKMRPHNYDGDAGEAKGFAVARGSKIAHTVSIETIEYYGGQNSFPRRRGPPPGGIIMPWREGEWLEQ